MKKEQIQFYKSHMRSKDNYIKIFFGVHIFLTFNSLKHTHISAQKHKLLSGKKKTKQKKNKRSKENKKQRTKKTTTTTTKKKQQKTKAKKIPSKN